MPICPQCQKQLTAPEMAGGCCANCGGLFSPEGTLFDRSISIDASINSDSRTVSVVDRSRTDEGSVSKPEAMTVESGTSFSMETCFTRECDLPVPMRTMIINDDMLDQLENDSTAVETGDSIGNETVRLDLDADSSINQDSLDSSADRADQTLAEDENNNADPTIRLDDEKSSVVSADQTFIEESSDNPDQTIRMDGDISAAVDADQTFVEEELENAEQTMRMDGTIPEAVTGDQTFIEQSSDSADQTIRMDDELHSAAKADRTLVENSIASSVNKPEGVNRRVGRSSRPSTASNPTESLLNIQPRLLAKSGTASPELSMLVDYEIVKELGKGGMGEVWLAKQTSLNREVALKQIRMSSHGQDSPQKIESMRNSFLSEAVVTGELNHPNIVPVYDMGTDVDGNLLYSMKVVRGTSWDRSIRSNPEAENIEILRKVADAIGFAHSRGVIHRDLKPANIMVGSYGEVLVMDWGTALPLANFSKASEIRSVSGCAGTPAYMPPEQAEGDIAKIGPHSDIYLLGAILFEIVAGYPPHPLRRPDSKPLTTRELLTNAYENLIVETTASGELLDIALKAIQKSPGDRYQKVEDFIEALKNYQKHAESVIMVNQARKDLEAANGSNDYSMFARAVYGFENALNLWAENLDAKQGLTTARLDYANAALRKEDFDLGLSLIRLADPIYAATHKQLICGQQERQKRVARLRTTRRLLAVSLLAAFLIVAVAAIWINHERIIAQGERDKALIAEREARAAQAAEELATIQATKERDKAVVAAEEELKAKKLAELAEIEARNERDKAVLAAEAETIAKNEAVREWYYSQINLADQMVAQNAFDSAREILGKIESRLHDSQLKNEKTTLASEVGWEFQRLKYVCSLGDGRLGDQKIVDSVKLTAVAGGNQLFATANARGEIEVWNNETPSKLLRTIKTDSRPVSMALSPDAEVIATGDVSGSVTLWNARTGEMLDRLGKHERDVTRLLYLPEGQLVSTSRDKTVRVWNIKEKSSKVLKGHTDGILSLSRAANQEGATIGLISGDSNRGEILFWKWPTSDLSKGEKVASNEKTAFTALATQLRGDNLVVFAGTDDGNIKAIPFSISSDRRTDPKMTAKVYSLVRQPTDRHKGKVTALLIDPGNPDRLISTSQDNTIRTWNIAPAALSNPSDPQEKQVLLQKTLRGHGNSIVDLVAWKDDRTGFTKLLTASMDGTARLWRPDVFPDIVALGGATLDRDAGGYGEIISVAVGGTMNDRVMAIASDGSATIWQTSDNPEKTSESERVSLNEGHRFLTQSAILLKDALVTTSFDGTAAVWDTNQTKAMLARLPDVGTTGVLAGSNDGRWVITGYAPHQKVSDKNLQIWSLAKLLSAARSKGIQAPSMVPLPVMVGKSVYPIDKAKPVPDLPSSAAISPDGDWGIVGTENGYLNLVEFGLGENAVKTPIEAHTSSFDPESQIPEGVTGVAFLSNSDLASVGLDGKLRFWAIYDGNLIPHPRLKTYVHADGKVVHRVVGMVASADGRRIATRLRATKSNTNTSNIDFQQIWISDIDAHEVKPFAKLQGRSEIAESEEKVESLSISSDGQRILATVMMTQKAPVNQKQTVLREWTLTKGRDSLPQDVLTSSPGFNLQHATYLPGEDDRITILSDVSTTIRKRTARQDFRDSPVSSFGPTVGLQACDVSHDGQLAVTASDSVIPATERAVDGLKQKARIQGEIRVWNIGQKPYARIGRLAVDGPVRSLAISPATSNWILIAGNLPVASNSGTYTAELYEWTGQDLIHIQSLGNHSQGIVRCRFSADGRRVVTASSDGHVELFELVDNKFQSIQILNLCSSASTPALRELISVDLSHDGTLLLAADKSSAEVIDVASGRPVIDPPLQGHSGDITDVRFALRPDVKAPVRLWTTSKDGTVKFWGIELPAETQDLKANTARLLLTLRGHQSGVLTVAALPDGGVVTGGEDGQVILWPISLPK